MRIGAVLIGATVPVKVSARRRFDDCLSLEVMAGRIVHSRIFLFAVAMQVEGSGVTALLLLLELFVADDWVMARILLPAGVVRDEVVEVVNQVVLFLAALDDVPDLLDVCDIGLWVLTLHWNVLHVVDYVLAVISFLLQ